MKLNKKIIINAYLADNWQKSKIWLTNGQNFNLQLTFIPPHQDPLISLTSLFMQDRLSMNSNHCFYSSYRADIDLQFLVALWLRLRTGTRERMPKNPIRFRSHHLWLLSLSTIFTLCLFYVRWSHVWNMGSTNPGWAKPYTFLNL